MQSDTAKTPRTERHANKCVDHGIKDTRLPIIHSRMSTGNSNNGQPPTNNEVMTSAQAPVATLLLPPPPPAPVPVAAFTRNLTSTQDRNGHIVTVGGRVWILENRQYYAGFRSSFAQVSSIWRIGNTNFVLAKMEKTSDNDEVVRINTNKTDFPTVNGQKIDEIAIRSIHVMVVAPHINTNNDLRIKIKEVIPFGYQGHKEYGQCCLCLFYNSTKCVVDYEGEEHWMCEMCALSLMGEKVSEDLDALEAASTTSAGKRPRESVDGDSNADPNGKRPAVQP